MFQDNRGQSIFELTKRIETEIYRFTLVILIMSISIVGSIFGESSAAGLRIHRFQSSVFQNSRLLRVWLPPDYHDFNDKRYPVLYLNDGQNLFDASTAQYSGQEWRVDEIAADLIGRKEIPPIIVVGIDNAGKQMRANEYLPWEDIFLSPPCPNPQGKKYPDFLTVEVLPFIEGRYRVEDSPESRALGGSSYGGLITLYTITAHPGKFGLILVESPSIYVDDTRLLKENKDFRNWPKRVYVGVGTHEGRSSCSEESNEEAVTDVLRLETLIRKNSPSTSLKVVVEKCGLHNEEAYSRRLPEALRFLFRD
jgi:predicted alpha/beta superfamily hydrolase